MEIPHPPASGARQKKFPQKFQVILRSKAMRTLAAAIHATREEHFLVELIVGPNRRELSSFVQHVMELRGAQDTHLVFTDRIDPDRLDDPSLKTVVFTRGEQIPHVVMEGFKRGHYQHLRGVIVVYASVQRHEHHDLNEALTPEEEFRQLMTARLLWPSWQKRAADRTRIFNEIYRRLNVPDGRTKPAFGRTIADLLLSMPFKGSDDVVRFFADALKRYIRSGENRDFVSDDFIPNDDVNARLSDRATPNLELLKTG